MDNGTKQRDSPKRYTNNTNNANGKDYRYKGMDYPNFNSDRTRQSKKGTYNFHRVLTTSYMQRKNIIEGEITRSTLEEGGEKRSEGVGEQKPTTVVNDGNVWKIENVRDKSNEENLSQLMNRNNDVPLETVIDKKPQVADDKKTQNVDVGGLNVADGGKSQAADDRRPYVVDGAKPQAADDRTPQTADDKRAHVIDGSKPQMEEDMKKHQITDDKKSQKSTEKRPTKATAKAKVPIDDGSGKMNADDGKDVDGFTKVRNRKRQKSESHQ